MMCIQGFLYYRRMPKDTCRPARNGHKKKTRNAREMQKSACCRSHISSHLQCREKNEGMDLADRLCIQNETTRKKNQSPLGRKPMLPEWSHEPQGRSLACNSMK